MLVDTQYLPSTKNLVVSYVDKSGNIKLKYYKWPNPKKYVVCDDEDSEKDQKYKSWDGKSIKLVDSPYPNRYSIYEFLDTLPENEREEIFEFNLPNIYFIDIETEIADGFPEAADIKDEAGNVIKEGAATKVLSISIVYEDKIILLGLKDLSSETQTRILDNTNKYFKKLGTTYKFKYVKYDSEFDMMYNFFNTMVPKMSVMTGWNFVNYDWIYLVNRSRKLKKKINGKEITIDPAVASPTKKMNKIWLKDYEMPAHKMIFDYMQLYEICDTTIKIKESSKLEFVSNKLIGLEKIKYNGSLQKLYEDDFETFMYYNAVDSVLVQKIHDAKNYISIIYAISSLSRIKITDVLSKAKNNLGTLAITEGVLRHRFKDQMNAIIFKDDEKEGSDEGTIEGGFVKDPIVGMNKWCVCYDFASLYPRTQWMFFISPENFVGIKDVNNPQYCTNGVEIDYDNSVVCNNNCVFLKRISPTINMLIDVYSDRKKNKGLMMRKKEEYKKIMDEIKQLEAELED